MIELAEYRWATPWTNRKNQGATTSEDLFTRGAISPQQREATNITKQMLKEAEVKQGIKSVDESPK